MKLNKIISSVLAFAVIFGTLAGSLPVFVFASDAEQQQTELTISAAEAAALSLHQTYTSAQDKLDNDPYMKLYASNGQYELYANPYTGEVYTKDTVSGQILTSNPYYIGDEYDNDIIPKELLSQFQIAFKNNDGSETIYGSYDWSASRGQIYLTKTANGIRMDYTIGDTTARYLAPNGISKERFETLIIKPAQNMLCEIIKEMVQEKRGDYVEDADGNRTYDNDATIRGYIQNSKYSAMTLEQIYAYFDSYSADEYQAAIDECWARIDAHTAEMARVEAEEPDDEARKAKLNTMKAQLNGMKQELKEKGSIIDGFDKWFKLAYLYFKEICGGSREFKQYQGMFAATADYFSMVAVYAYKDPNVVGQSLREDIIEAYPATEDIDNTTGRYFALYALDNGIPNNKKRTLQETISKYAPEYTMEMMYEDEAETQLEPEIEVNPVFRLALVYSLTEKGISVTLPAKSISYDETKYTIEYIDVLPYMGAGDMNDGGYVFYPDGSGAIVDYEDFAQKNITISGEIYGHDYSFHTLTGANQQSIRMPVYGSTSDQKLYYFNDFYTGEKAYVSQETYLTGEFIYKIMSEAIKVTIPGKLDDSGNPVTHATPYYRYFYLTDSNQKVYLPENDTISEWKDGDTVIKTVNWQYYITASGTRVPLDPKSQVKDKTSTVSTLYEESYTNGFIAIVEEGSAMAKMYLCINGASLNPYAAISTRFAPLPQDTYNLQEANASADDVMFTVTSDCKYLDNLTVDYVMLTDEKIIAANALTTDYKASYIGMANVYRDYLTDEVTGILSAISEEDIESKLPLYIETLGVMQTTEKILSFPVEVDVALTSFEDIKTMYEELSEEGITNVKFKLTGYANGGMNANYPVKLKWEKKAGGKSGFRDLMDFVSSYAEQGLQIFPDFDVQYVVYDRLFDGIRYKKVSAKTVDNRYAYKKEYNRFSQQYDQTLYGIIVAPNFITELYDRFNRRYLKYDNDSISLTSVAADLSSSYDEDEYILREDAMKMMVSYLGKVAENYRIMSGGGNIYALQYVDYLLNAPIDSSHFRAASYTIPFFGMVMHGLVSYAGSPFNEEGNADYQILRSIESGASLYFILAYANTKLLKDDVLLNSYYSVDYQIWKEDVVSYYNELNNAIGNLQDFLISDHRQISVEREIEGVETRADREKLEAELLTKLEEQINAGLQSKDADIRVIRTFYKNSIAKIAKIIYQAELEGNGEYDGKFDENELNSARYNELIASMDEENETEYNIYLSYLNLYKTQLRDIKPHELKDADILAKIGVDPTMKDTVFADKVIDALVNKLVSPWKGQKTEIAFDRDMITSEAINRIGIDVEIAAKIIAEIKAMDTTPINEESQLYIKYKDFYIFIEALNAKFDELDQEAVGGIETAKMTINVSALTYESAYSYVTYSVATDEAYIPTVYTIDDGSVVMVTYTKGSEAVRFVLNYNTFGVNVRLSGVSDIIQIGAQSYYKITD